jgi:hypothetical protein
MKTPAAFCATITCASLLASTVILAAETKTWPWLDTAPVDPALALLSKINSLSVKITELKDPTLHIKVEAQAPTPGFTEIKLTPRIGDPNDKIFAFDVRGRRPQEIVTQVLTPVTIDVAYEGAPLASVDVVEVYSQANCLAYSLKTKTAVDCTMNPGSQDIP